VFSCKNYELSSTILQILSIGIIEGTGVVLSDCFIEMNLHG